MEAGKIEIRVMPNGRMSAWWKGELLPVLVTDVTDRTDRHVFFGCKLGKSATFGREPSQQEIESVPQETKDAARFLFGEK